MRYYIFLICVLIFSIKFYPQDIKLIIAMDKYEFVLGERVSISMSVYNASDEVIECHDARSITSYQYSFNFFDSDLNEVYRLINTSQEGYLKSIAPNDYLKKNIHLTDDFTNTGRIGLERLTSSSFYGIKTGNYSFQVIYDFKIITKASVTRLVKLESNILHFTILPVTDSVDSQIANTLKEHYRSYSQEDDEYDKALDFAKMQRNKSHFYPMVLKEIIFRQQYCNQLKLGHESMELFGELVKVAPHSSYAADCFYLLSSRKMIESNQKNYEKLLSGNPFMYPMNAIK